MLAMLESNAKIVQKLHIGLEFASHRTIFALRRAESLFKLAGEQRALDTCAGA